MKKMLKILIIFILILLTALTTGIYAQRGYRSQVWPVEKERQIPEVRGLTEEQQEQIKNLRTDYLKDIQPLKNELKINKAKLDALLTEDNPDMNEINKLIDDNGKIQTELRKKQVSHQMEIRNLLSDEQKVIFDRWDHRDNIRPYRHPRKPYGNVRTSRPYRQYRYFR